MPHYGPYDDVEDFADPAPPIPQPGSGAGAEELPFKEGVEYTDEQALEEFGELEEYLRPERKKLPYKGIVYEFPATCNARSWLTLQVIRREGQKAALAEKRGTPYDAEAVLVNDDEEEALRQDLMGDAYDELVEDGVPGHVIERMFGTLMIWHLSGKDLAVSMWKGEVSQGEAAARGNREQRRKAARQQRAKGSRQAGR